MKKCNACGLEKDVSEFPQQNGKPKSWCKLCRNAYERTRYTATDGETERKRLSSRVRKLGATPAEIDYITERSGGVCELCGVSPATHLDHDHNSGEMRGLLCNNCNRGLGLLGDDLESLVRAVEYLKKFG